MLGTANQELTIKAEALANAYAVYEKSEQEMTMVTAGKVSKTEALNENADDYSKLRECRLNFQDTIESLSQAKKNYIQALNFWFEEITDTGVILRDIKSGLLDFPASEDNFEYFLCWRLGEDEISSWHPINEGFIGRRSLAVLNEYV